MYELIKSSLSAYVFVTVFIGWCFFLVIYTTFKNSKNMENKKIKTVLRFGISGALVCLWAWHFVYMNLYPISLAYYEYRNEIIEEKIGVIENIDQDGKDRINIIVNNKEYTIAHSSASPVVIIGRDIDKVDIVNFKEITKGTARCVIDEGDTVKFKFGAKSKFIFDIYKTE